MHVRHLLVPVPARVRDQSVARPAAVVRRDAELEANSDAGLSVEERNQQIHERVATR